MTDTTPVLIVLCCPRCGHSLGTHDRARLFLGSAVIIRSVTLQCAVCGRTRTWSPANPPAVLDTPTNI